MMNYKLKEVYNFLPLENYFHKKANWQYQEKDQPLWSENSSKCFSETSERNKSLFPVSKLSDTINKTKLVATNKTWHITSNLSYSITKLWYFNLI